MEGSISSRDRRNPDESSILDPESLDPEKHYRFFHVSDSRIARAKALGYRAVKRGEGKNGGVRTMYDEDDDDGTGVIQHGDRVLFEISKEKYDSRRRRKQNIATRRLRGPAEQVKEMARRNNVRMEGKSKNEPADEEE